MTEENLKHPGGISPVSAGKAHPELAERARAPFDRQTLLLCLALMAVVFVCYSRVVHNAFVTYDDNEYIDNPHVKVGLKWSTVAWAFTSFDESNWHPVTWLTHALDWQVFGFNATGPHCVNVLLHALNAILLFLLLQYATGFRWRSLMVAALFALHPINVESVAWAAERKTVLSTLFFLLAVYAYVWYTRGPSRQRYAAVAGFFALALMAKPQVITLPFLLLLLDYWPLGRGLVPGSRFSVVSSGAAANKSSATATPHSFYFLLREKVPLLLLSAVSAMVTMAAQRTGGAVKDLAHFGVTLRLETAVIAYARYLGKALWPRHLVAMYPHPTRLYPGWQVGGALLLLLAITALVLRAREQRYLQVGWLWFLGSLVPMIGLVQVGEQELADRYAYISFIGLFVMAVWLVADWAKTKTRGVPARWLAVPAAACLLALGIFTYRQVGYWHDSESFWRRTVALTQDNYIAHKGLGSLLYVQGRTQEGLEQVRDVIAIRPDEPYANLILGDYAGRSGNLTEALERYRIVTVQRINPTLRAQAYADMGYIYRQLKQPMKAKPCFETSLQLVPKQPVLMVQLGLIAQLDEKDNAAAVRDYAAAMKLQPTDVGLLLLGNALLEEGGHDDEANKILERADRISKNIYEAQKQAQALVDAK